MSDESTRSLRIIRRFDVSAERVFDAWLDPERAGKWLFATPGGEMVRVEIDARPGGSFTFTERREGGDVEHVGEYMEVDRPRRLVFTFAVPKYSALKTMVTIEIEPLPGGCELTLLHEGVLPEWADRTLAGWGKLLATAAREIDPNAARGVAVEPGIVRFERLLPGPIERVWAFLVDGDKRSLWLASGGMEPLVSGQLDLRFEHMSLSSHQSPPPERFKDHPVHITRERVTRYEPPTVLAWTWGGGAAGAPSEVTFELTPKADQVLLTLTHRKLVDRTAMADVAGGWHTHLAVLVDRVNGREPGAFWTIFAETDGEYAGKFGAA